MCVQMDCSYKNATNNGIYFEKILSQPIMVSLTPNEFSKDENNVDFSPIYYGAVLFEAFRKLGYKA